MELSKKEIEVFGLILEGKSNKEIADNLFISINTAKTHVSSILRKKNAKNRLELVAKNINQKSVKAILLLLFIFVSQLGRTQAVFKDKDGQVKKDEIVQSEKDLKVSVPVPSDYKNHDLILVNISLESKTGNTAENKALFPLSNAQYYKDLKPAYLEGKESVELWAFKSDQTSDFSYISYPNQTNYFNLDRVAGISQRTEQKYDLVVRVYGKDISEYEYKDDGWGNMVKEPVYSYHLISTYKITYDAGKPSDQITSDNHTFSFPKVDQNIVDLWVSYVDLSENSTRHSYQINPKDQIILKSTSGADNYFYIKGISVPTAKVSLTDLKDKIAENLVRDANSYYNYNSLFHEDDLIYLENLCATYDTGKDGNEEEGLKGKFNKFKAELSDQKVTEEDIQAKLAYAREYLKWEPANFGGVSCEKLSLQIYTRKELVGNSNARVYEVDPNKKDKTRSFDLYIGQKGDHVYMFCMYKFGEQSELNKDEAKLKDLFQGGVLFN